MKKKFIFLISIPLIVIGFFGVGIASDYFENDLKYLMRGYSYVNYAKDGDQLKYNDKRIDDFALIGINHFLNYRENVTKEYLDKCFIGETKFDVQCMYALKEKDIPILVDDKCEWVYYAYETAVKVKDHYLVNHPERFCGSLSFRLFNHYLFKYDGRYLELTNYVLAHKVSLQGEIKMIKITDEGIHYIDKPCQGHIDQNCLGLRAEEFFFKINS